MERSAASRLHFLSAGLLAVACGLVPPSGCSSSKDKPAPSSEAPVDVPQAAVKSGDPLMSLSIQSAAFESGAPIPKRFTGDGDDVSPTLTWQGITGDAKELALIVDDPDAPTPAPWVHWVIYKIPASLSGLSEAVPTTEALSVPAGALQGKNSWGKTGYGGPAPPRGHGTHHYHFKLFALDASLDLAPGLTKAQLLAAMEGHVLATGELVGTYQR